MEKDRSKVNIKEQTKTDTITGIDPQTNEERNFTFVKEIIDYDSDGNIIGVAKIWQ